MNANSQQKASTIKEWLTSAEKQLLQAGISSARLDSELILANAIGKHRTYLHAYPDKILSPKATILAKTSLKQRTNRTPLAYITGRKEFYGRVFEVTPAVLIPRPESENIIESIRELFGGATELLPNPVIADVGTGSGCLACSIKLEIPNSTIIASDVSPQALDIATRNATQLQASIDFRLGDLLEPYTETLDCIVANLPYVDISWSISPETKSEPDLALFAENQGLELIYRLLRMAPTRQEPGGYLILESDKRQHGDIKNYAKKMHYSLIDTNDLIQVFRYQ